MTECTFFVPGIAKTAGSKRAFYNKKLGRAMIVDACDNKDWKTAVGWYARSVWTGPPTEQPVSLTVRFVMRRPKDHYGTGKNAGTLKPGAPEWHTSKPDSTKLLRCLEDALTGIIWKDDAQICQQFVSKTYGDTPGAMVTIESAI